MDESNPRPTLTHTTITSCRRDQSARISTNHAAHWTTSDASPLARTAFHSRCPFHSASPAGSLLFCLSRRKSVGREHAHRQLMEAAPRCRQLAAGVFFIHGLWWRLFCRDKAMAGIAINDCHPAACCDNNNNASPTAEKPRSCFRGCPWLCKGETRSHSYALFRPSSPPLQSFAFCFVFFPRKLTTRGSKKIIIVIIFLSRTFASHIQLCIDNIIPLNFTLPILHTVIIQPSGLSH